MNKPCPLCGEKLFHQVFSLEKAPLFQNKVYSSAEESKTCPTGNIQLLNCTHCNFVFNGCFTPESMSYDKDYQNEQNYSATFQQYLEEIRELLSDYTEGKAIEIGCGKGYFLNALRENGFDVTGFDPAYEGTDPNIVKDYFSKKYDISGDLVILRHTLEHVEKPRDFIAEIATQNRNQGTIYIEVPDFKWIYQKRAFWDIFYEHCNYFSLETLQKLFKKSKSGYLFGKQYIYVLARLEDFSFQPTKTIEPKDYKNVFCEKISKIHSLLRGIEAKRIYIWGAGAKGVSLCNLLDPEHGRIQGVIDINPKKQGKHVGGTGHLILSPEEYKKEAGEEDILIIMNENYKTEILESLTTTPKLTITMGEI